METIVTLADAVTAFADYLEPTDAELDALEVEMPAVLADVELTDALIATLDRTPSELDARRVRRAYRRLLNERAQLANRTAAAMQAGGAA
ncbi:DUF6284 family protein [Streptomyces sp. UH6]|uniref:DUF6284 family protein n=1 Tax=Streptomyces sp. UH6 TaxID=2748379 RepID=UPI0015D4720F|nr:DUF6284 family protein [Streptomyces sp. UH6]NYV74394.1 hypothetical protein [Streptomyces sp. UH6]